MLQILRKINEWWETGEIPAELVPETKRKAFEGVIDSLDDRRVISIIGPRRTGKTTLMFQVMDHLLKKAKVDPKKVLFFSGDDVELRETVDLIGTAVKTYFEEFLRQDYRGEKTYIFIDEVHRIKDWQLWLKKFYDLKYNIKFIISGSSATKIKREQKESLAGRTIEFVMFPLSFREFLSFQGVALEPKTISFPDLEHRKLVAVADRFGPKRILSVKRWLDEYMLVGGFPEWFETKSVRKWQIKLRGDIVKKVIYDDIASTYGVKNAFKLEVLLGLLAALQSRIYSYNSIANTLKIDNETSEQYVNYLKESFLIFELRNYAASAEKRIRKNYKYVLVDAGLRNVLERIGDISKLSDEEVGYLVEGVVQQHILWSAEEWAMGVFYWKEGKDEVDLVVMVKDRITPIEVKYRSKITSGDIKGLLNFMDAYKLRRGVVVTKDLFENRKMDRKEIFFIPAWLFLFLC